MDDYTFELPSLSRATAKQYPVTVAFDFEKGEFVLDGKGNFKFVDENTSTKSWCQKALNIERYSRLAYSKNLGIELSELKLYTSRETKESWLRRTIEETLMSDPKQRVAQVDQFVFTYPEPDSVVVTFVVTLKNGTVFDMEKEFTNG